LWNLTCTIGNVVEYYDQLPKALCFKTLRYSGLPASQLVVKKGDIVEDKVGFQYKNTALFNNKSVASRW
jgi:hypothetical protein